MPKCKRKKIVGFRVSCTSTAQGQDAQTSIPVMARNTVTSSPSE